MSHGPIWSLGAALCLALLTLGCSQSEKPQTAAQPTDGGWVEASVPPPPPVPATGSSSNWQEAPVEARSAAEPVSTELPPGFVEVAPPTPPAPPSVESQPASSGDFTDVSRPKPEATSDWPAGSSGESEAVEPAPGSTPAIATFLAANKATVAKLEELQATLASIRDDATARAAAEKLPQVTEQFIAQSKTATALMLTLPEQEKKQALQQLQLESIRKLREGGPPMRADLIELCEGIAKGPQRAIMHDAIVAMRDEMLDQHSIYVPVTTREKIAKRLGTKGSPLPQ
jgi:hypothetical protein